MAKHPLKQTWRKHLKQLPSWFRWVSFWGGKNGLESGSELSLLVSWSENSEFWGSQLLKIITRLSMFMSMIVYFQKSLFWRPPSHFCNFHRSKSNYFTEITWIVKFEATSISVRSFHMTLSDNYTSPPPTAQFHFIIYWLNVMLQHHSEKIITPDELKCFHSSIAHQGLHFGVSN